MTRSGAPSARVAVDWPIDSRITLPPPNTASSPPTQRSSLDLDPAGRCRRGGCGRRWSARTARRSGRGRDRSRHAASSGPATSPRSPATIAAPGERHELDRRVTMPGSKRTDVPAGTSRRMPARRGAVERQRRVGLGEVVVRADLDRPVAGVHDRRARCTGRPALSSIGAVAADDLARDHGRVTGSARAASPAWCRRGTWPRPAPRRPSRARPPSRRRGEHVPARPASGRRPVRPSRAASSTQSERIATASGWLSSQAPGLAVAGHVGGHVDEQALLFVRGQPHRRLPSRVRSTTRLANMAGSASATSPAVLDAAAVHHRVALGQAQGELDVLLDEQDRHRRRRGGARRWRPRSRMMIDGWMPSVGSSSTSSCGPGHQRPGDGQLLGLAARQQPGRAVQHRAPAPGRGRAPRRSASASPPRSRSCDDVEVLRAPSGCGNTWWPWGT